MASEREICLPFPLFTASALQNLKLVSSVPYQMFKETFRGHCVEMRICLNDSNNKKLMSDTFKHLLVTPLPTVDVLQILPSLSIIMALKF